VYLAVNLHFPAAELNLTRAQQKLRHRVEPISCTSEPYFWQRKSIPGAMSLPTERPPKNAGNSAPGVTPQPPARNWRKIAKATHLKTQALQQQFDELKAENSVKLISQLISNTHSCSWTLADKW